MPIVIISLEAELGGNSLSALLGFRQMGNIRWKYLGIKHFSSFLLKLKKELKDL